VHLVAPCRVRPDRLDANQILEIAPDIGEYLAHARDQITHSGENTHARADTKSHDWTPENATLCLLAGKSERLEDRHRGSSVTLVRQRHMDDDIGEMLGDLTGQPHFRATPHIGDHLDIPVETLRQHRTLREP